MNKQARTKKLHNAPYKKFSALGELAQQHRIIGLPNLHQLKFQAGPEPFFCLEGSKKSFHLLALWVTSGMDFINLKQKKHSNQIKNISHVFTLCYYLKKKTTKLKTPTGNIGVKSC